MQARFIVEFHGSDIAIVELGGVRKAISIALVPEAQLGDHVIVHVGQAIGMRCRDTGTAAGRCRLRVAGAGSDVHRQRGQAGGNRRPEAADAVLAAMHAYPLGRSAGRIGHVTAAPHRFVQMTTAFSGRRVVDG